MSRVKKAVHALKYRRKLLRDVKGYRHGRSKKERLAMEAYLHAGAHAFAHRRDKKNDFRRLWNVKINAFVRGRKLTYSKFINLMKKKGVGLDRKILASIAQSKPETFARLISHIA